jgi:hypothetical protein
MRDGVSGLRRRRMLVPMATLGVVSVVVALAPAAARSSSVAPPSITLSVSGRTGDNGWYLSDVNVSWTVSDPTGISSTSGCGPIALTSDTEGTTLTCSATNKAKPPLSNSVSVTIKIDKTPPRLSDVSIAPGDGRNVLQWRSTSRSDTVRIERSLRRAKAPAQVFPGRRGQSFTDTSIRNGREYIYVLVARDGAGNVSRHFKLLALPKVLTLEKLPYLPRVSVSPILRWRAVPGATYYHVQLFRGGKRILAAWPRKPQLALHPTWSWNGRRYRLDPGTYRWYVWAGFGARAAAHYKRLGTAAFAVQAL